MNISSQLKAIVVAASSSFAALAFAFAAGKISRPSPAASEIKGKAPELASMINGTRRGYELFQQNCAHCHGSDARGDEGPDLHGVTKSDARIKSIITNGIKGEMPKFGAKLTDAEVAALISFVRSLKD